MIKYYARLQIDGFEKTMYVASPPPRELSIQHCSNLVDFLAVPPPKKVGDLIQVIPSVLVFELIKIDEEFKELIYGFKKVMPAIDIRVS